MTVMFIIVAAGSVLMLVLFTWYRHAKSEVRRLRRYRYYADRFYERIQPVVSDQETPVEVLDFIGFFNGQIVDPMAARMAYMALELMVEEKNGRERSPAGSSRENVYDFFERRSELREPFEEAMSGALLAITYSNRYWGPRARNLIALVGRHTEFAPAVAKDIRDRSDKHHGGMNGAVPAAA